MRPDAEHNHPSWPAPGTVLCCLEDIPVKGRGFVFGEGKEAFRVFVVRRDDMVFAYVNRCPHFGVPLDSGRDRFLNLDDTRIFCTQHCAEFRIEDGYCMDGPAQGHSLDPVPIRVACGEVILD
ncbi:MAG TPA: Rieske 2Fe-2S domain-containing protein [Gammaproteobacteria bacterium]|nr:Rieske 2Fe-2S domain-containing protein [Gammaproteobacteria bacterium]